MGSIVQMLFDALFPPSEEELIVRNTAEADISELLQIRKKEGVTVLSAFQNTTVAALIHEAKFHNNQRATALLALLLKEYLEISNATEDAVCIAMPLFRARERERGYNQVHEILKKAGLPIHKKILKRVRNTERQTELPRAKRLENMQGAFRVSNPAAVKNRVVILIDDVTTTGATMHEARKALRACEPKRIHCIALAG